MAALPKSCTHCRRPFSVDGHRTMAHLERAQALCDECVWLVEHPEAPVERRKAAPLTAA